MPNKNQYRKISIVTVGDSIGLIHSLTVAHAILCELLASFFTTSGIIHAILLHEAQPPLKLVCRIFFFCGSAGLITGWPTEIRAQVISMAKQKNIFNNRRRY